MTAFRPPPFYSNAHRRWFSPPRAHGDTIEGRTVSFLELFYDLVFVVLIAQLAHTLAGHVDWVGFRNFAVVFGLVWIAWLNGTMYHELHGGDDGRSRMYIFGQMTLMVPLAVFAGHAADELDDGRNFAIVYTLLLLFIAWQWFDVRRFDVEEWRPIVMRYVTGMLVIAAVVFASATPTSCWRCASRLPVRPWCRWSGTRLTLEPAPPAHGYCRPPPRSSCCRSR